MRSEQEIFKDDYIRFTITTADGTKTVDFSNQEVRGAVEVNDGRSIEIFTSEDGTTSSMARLRAPFAEFTLRSYESPFTRQKLQTVLDALKIQSKISFEIRQFVTAWDAWPPTSTSQDGLNKSIQVKFDQCTLDFSDVYEEPIDAVHRGVGAIRGNLTLRVNETKAFAFPQAPCALINLQDFTIQWRVNSGELEAIEINLASETEITQSPIWKGGIIYNPQGQEVDYITSDSTGVYRPTEGNITLTEGDWKIIISDQAITVQDEEQETTKSCSYTIEHSYTYTAGASVDFSPTDFNTSDFDTQ